MPRPVPTRTVLRWSLAERETAADWAANVHLLAGDNPINKKKCVIPKHVRKAAAAMGFTMNDWFVYDIPFPSTPEGS